MATIVHYTGRNGTPDKATFPNRLLALMFARNVKGVRLEDTTTETPEVKVSVLPLVKPSRSDLWKLGLTEDKRSGGKKGGAP